MSETKTCKLCRRLCWGTNICPDCRTGLQAWKPDTAVPATDPINKPQHYIDGRKFEPLDVILDWKLGYLLGNALKYISRAGRKDNEVADLKKAVFYLQRRINELEK